MMARRTPRALALSLFALFLVVTFAGCGDDAGIVSPDPVADPDPKPETVAPVPETAPIAYTQQFTSSDRCTLPRSNYARFTRVFEGIEDGTIALDAASGWSTCNRAPDDPNASFTWQGTSEGYTWSATVPVGALVLWSGDRGIVYWYVPESRGDTGLSGPTDPNTGEELPVDAITLCHDYVLDVGLDLVAEGGAGATWSISSDVIPTQWQLLPGDRGTSRAFVTLQRVDTAGTEPRLVGTVELVNPSPVATTVTSAYAVIGFGTQVPLDLTLPLVLAGGQSVTTTFERAVSSTSSVDCQVIVSTRGDVEGGRAASTADFAGGADAVELVTSDGQRFGPFSRSEQIVVDRTFAAGDVASSSADLPWDFVVEGVDGVVDRSVVAVQVLAPMVDVDLDPRFTQDWQWSVAVETDHATTPLPDPFDGFVPMRARVTSTPGSGSDYGVGGTVTVTNPHPSRALALSEVVVAAGGFAVTLGTGVEIAAASGVVLPVDLDLGVVTTSAMVRVEYVGRDIAWNELVTPGDLVARERSVALGFDVPTTVVDASARVTDAFGGDLGTVVAGNGETVLAFDVFVDPLLACGPFALEGRTELVTTDRLVSVVDTWSFAIDVPCASAGCTRTAEQWAGHRDDPAWNRLPEGPRTRFLDSPYSWSDVLDPRTRGGLYRVLAAQYVAARLNALAGADTSEVAEAMMAAEAWLRTHTPGDPPAREAKDAARLANQLRDFNTGQIGPGACAD